MSLLITQGLGTFGPGTFNYLLTTSGMGGPGGPVPVPTGFSLSSATPIALATIRVVFTMDPLLVSSAGIHDGLNIANYLLTGPAIANILSVAPVFGNNAAVDLFLANPLASGIWTLTASTFIRASDNVTIMSAPFSESFLISSSGTQEPVNMGAENETQCAIMRGFLNPALQGDAWQALCCAVATGDAQNAENARLAFDQLFTITASDIYLTRLASDDGITRPTNIGMADSLFRQYAISLANGKVVENSLLEIMEVFYGVDSVRAHQDSTIVEPFFFNDGDNLIVKLDNITVINTIFTTADFAIIGVARAAEVAAALTRSFRFNRTDAYSLAHIDPVTGAISVRIYSGSLGLGSSVEILGGSAQNQLKYPTQVITKVSGQPTWNITFDPVTTITRFSPSSPEFDMSQVHIGDYANIYGAVFDANNRGTYTITNVYWAYPDGINVTQYFEITNPLGNNQAGVLQANNNDLLIFRPTISTTHDIPAQAVVVSSIGEEVYVVLPATSSAVNRGKYHAAYIQANNSVDLVSLTRLEDVVTVVTGTAHGLVVGGQVDIEGTFSTNTVPPIVPGAVHGGGPLPS